VLDYKAGLLFKPLERLHILKKETEVGCEVMALFRGEE